MGEPAAADFSGGGLRRTFDKELNRMLQNRDRFRFYRRGIAMVFVLLVGGPAVSQAKDPAATQEKPIAPITQGQRVFTCGHSFHYWIPPILSNMAQEAGIQGHKAVGLSAIGGSRVIQHWDVPDASNQAKKALRTGNVDVLTLSPMHQPDDGIEKFAALALEHNPKVRVTIQEFWIPWDKFEWPFKGNPEAVNFDAASIADLRKMHAPYFKAFDDYVVALNKKLGKQVVFVVPTGQAVLALREKIVAGEAPGLAKQSDLFSDKLGHPRPPLQALAAYCHFAVIYRTSPVGLPLPDVLADVKKPEWDSKLNRLLQELAWDAVRHHPLSGVQ
jgi:hypothetical protein